MMIFVKYDNCYWWCRLNLKGVEIRLYVIEFESDDLQIMVVTCKRSCRINGDDVDMCKF